MHIRVYMHGMHFMHVYMVPPCIYTSGPDQMDTLVWPPLVEPLLQDRVPEQNMWEMIGLESEDCPGLQLKVKDVMDVSTTADADSKDDFDSSLGLGTSEVHDPVPVANAPSPASFEQELAPTPCEEAAQEPPAGLDIPAEEPEASEDGQDLTNTEEEASIEQEEVGEVPEETDRGMDPPEQAERPGVLKRLPPISPAEQVKLSKPDKDPKKAGRGGRGRGGRGRGGRGRGVEKACAASRGRKRERSGESEPSESEPAAKGPKTRRAKAKAKATVSKAPPTDEATVHYSEEDESAEESQENGRTMKTARHREPEVSLRVKPRRKPRRKPRPRVEQSVAPRRRLNRSPKRRPKPRLRLEASEAAMPWMIQMRLRTQGRGP